MEGQTEKLPSITDNLGLKITLGDPRGSFEWKESDAIGWAYMVEH